MKKTAVVFLVALYAAQILFIAAGIVWLRTNLSWLKIILFALSAVLYVGALVLELRSCIVFILKPGENAVSYQDILCFKIAMFPYFAINFILCVCLVAGFLNPFLIAGLFVLIPVLVGLTYCPMVYFSIVSAVKTLRIISEKKEGNGAILFWQVLEFFFVVDVLAAIVLYIKQEKTRPQSGSERAE